MQTTCRNKEIWGHTWHASHLPFPTKQEKWQQMVTTKTSHQISPTHTQPYTIHTHNTTETNLRTRLHNPWQQKGTHHGYFHKQQIKTTQSTKTTEDNMAKKDAKKTEQDFESKFYFWRANIFQRIGPINTNFG
jgi:hypothetical protein